MQAPKYIEKNIDIKRYRERYEISYNKVTFNF